MLYFVFLPGLPGGCSAGGRSCVCVRRLRSGRFPPSSGRPDRGEFSVGVGIYPEIFREFASAVKREEVPPHRRKYRKEGKAD